MLIFYDAQIGILGAHNTKLHLLPYTTSPEVGIDFQDAHYLTTLKYVLSPYVDVSCSTLGAAPWPCVPVSQSGLSQTTDFPEHDESHSNQKNPNNGVVMTSNSLDSCTPTPRKLDNVPFVRAGGK